MPALFVYLLKVNLAIVLFYLVYYFLLRRLTFYTLNRFYLLFAFLFSALCPLVNFRDWFAGRQEVSEVIYYVVPDWTAVENSTFSIWPYLLSLFWAVVLFFLGRLAVRLFSLWQIHRSSFPARWQYFHFRRVMQRISHFSFWKNIYVHVEGHQDHELVEIFNHEQVHVEQLHTVDTLIAEFYSVLCWFNPAAWLMRYAVRENLEFITDRRVLGTGVDKRAYQYSLLHLSTGGQASGDASGWSLGTSLAAPEQLVSHFNLKHLKTRIMMMNKKQSSAAHLGKYVLAVPMIMLLALVLTVSRAVVNAAEKVSELPVLKLVEADTTKRTEARITLVLKEAVMEDVVLEDKPGQDSVIFPGDSTSATFQSTDEKDLPYVLIDGKKGDLNKLNPDAIEAIEVIKGSSAVEKYGSEAKNGIIKVTTKK